MSLLFRQLLGASIGPQVPATDFFADTGKTYPWYSAPTYPAAMYVASTDTTWFAWEYYSGANRGLRVTTYNHTSELWSAIASVGLHPLLDDDHGVPALCRDAGGYVHIFGGGHDSDVFEWVTKAADDPSAWTLRTTFTGAAYTYPEPVLVGSTLYLFLRRKDGVLNSARKLVLFKTTGITAGVPTWGTVQVIVDYGASSRVYAGPMILVGTDIHFTTTRSDDGDTFRRDQHYYVYETTTGDVHNAENDTTIDVLDLPVDLTESQADFRVVNTSTNDTNIAGFCFDSSGNAHLVYFDGTGSAFDIKHIVFSGGSWSSATTVSSVTQSRHSFLALVPLPSDEVALYYAEDPGAAWTVGGNIVRKVRSSGGSWGSATTVVSASGYALDSPSAVRSAHADARVIFCEIANDSDDAAGGDLKLYAYGDAGFLTRQPQAPTDIAITSLNVPETLAVGDYIATLSVTDTDFGDTHTYTIVADPDGKFQVDGDRLALAATVTHPATHSVTIRATDAYGLTRQEVFSMTVTENTDPWFRFVAVLLDGTQPGVGTDASFANVELLIQGNQT